MLSYFVKGFIYLQHIKDIFVLLAN